MKVKDAMHKGTTCVDPDTQVVTIAKCMRDYDVGAILVSADGRLVGIVTDRDIACRARRQDRQTHRQGHHDEGRRVLLAG